VNIISKQYDATNTLKLVVQGRSRITSAGTLTWLTVTLQNAAGTTTELWTVN
jgi:hypothetical protein